MPRRHKLPDELLSVPFSVREALALGVTPDRLRSCDLSVPFHGVRVVGSPQVGQIDRAVEYRPRMRSTDVFSHLTAATIWGMPLPQSVGGLRPIDVTATAPTRAPQVQGVRGRQLALGAGEVRVVRDLRVTSPALTWCLLGGILSLEDLIAAADYLVTPMRGMRALATRDELQTCLQSRARLRGSVRLRKALPWVRVGPLSRPESLFRVVAVRAGLPEPVLNQPIRGNDGRLLAKPDLAWPTFRLGAEYEGDYHRVTRGQFHHDIGRIERMVDAGWVVVRVSAPALFDETEELVARVGRRLESRGWRPEHPLDLRNVGQLRR